MNNAMSCDRKNPGTRARVWDWLAFLVSMATSPYLTMPLFTVCVISRYSPTSRDALHWILISFFFTTLIPFLDVLWGTVHGRIAEIHVKERKERIRPFLVAIVSSSVGTAILYGMGAGKEIVALGVTVVANGIVFASLNCLMKVSIHTAVVTVGVLVCGTLLNPWVFVLFLLIPVIVWGRMYRKRHSLVESLLAVPVALLVTRVVLEFFAIVP